MPWKERNLVTEKMVFISRLLDGERMTDLCREFGISRKTGHKLKGYYERYGIEGFHERSRRPLLSPFKTPRNMVEVIVQMRGRYPTWGPKKLRERLVGQHPGVHFPAASTIGVILKEEGLVKSRKKKRRAVISGTSLRETQHPNEVWGLDFKGQFRLGNQRYCYPLTVSDHFSRYLLGCEALESTQSGGSQQALMEIFKTYGLPDAIRSDNGAPFASTGRCGLSRLSVWLLRHGIQLERIEPGHPEQNGRHERLHLTLKQDTTRPPARTLLQQQERFDRFRECYNNERPHESLDMKTPSAVYQTSAKSFPDVLQPLTYPLCDFSLQVMSDGRVRFPLLHREIHVGDAFSHEVIGFREMDAGTWLVMFMDMEIGYLDSETNRILEIPNSLQSALKGNV